MGLESIEISSDSIDISTVDNVSSEIATLAKNILEGLQQGDVGAIAFAALVGSLTLWIGVFGVYFINLVKEKGFWGAMNDLETNYPMDPQQARLLREIKERSE